MDFEQFSDLLLPQGICLLGVEVAEAPMLDAIGRPALARAVIENGTIAIYLAADQAPAEMSVSTYHERLEAMTVGVASPPLAVCDLNEAGFERAAQDAHLRYGLANAASVLIFLHEFGFTD